MRFEFAEMAVGETRSGAACIASLEHRTTRAGKPFATAVLRNARGEAKTQVWSEQLCLWDCLEVGDPVEITAEIVDGWKDGPPELAIRTIDPLPDGHEVAEELHPVSTVSREEIERRLDAALAELERPEMAVLADVILRYERDGVTLRERFLRYPAAMRHHHHYLRGLAIHALEVHDIAVGIASQAPYAEVIDLDLVRLSALLHDIGKTDEYTFGPRTPISIGHVGRLRSHLSRGPELIALAVADCFALAAGVVLEDDVLALQHILESHHTTAYGSPVEPRSLEAGVVHLADLASARMAPMLQAIEECEPDEEGWVHPQGWRRDPVWHYAGLVGARAADTDADPEPVAKQEVWHRAQTTALLLPAAEEVAHV